MKKDCFFFLWCNQLDKIVFVPLACLQLKVYLEFLCVSYICTSIIFLTGFVLLGLQVSRLMDLIVHSLYSHKEVFLRELVR